MTPRECYRITWLIRRIFRAMGTDANERLHALGISAADRAVMEFLHPDQALSVPDIATRYNVSRQHVQVTVNALIGHRLVQKKPNPKHKRSPLIALTDAGRRLFADIREQDLERLAGLFDGLPDEALEHTLETLTALHQRLQKEPAS